MADVIAAIEERRTTVLYDGTRDVSDEQITELVRLATRAPTAFNLQNWRFIAVHSPDAKARLRAVAWDQAKITEAAVTFIIVGQMADETTLPDRLAPAVQAGLMPAAMVDGWVAGAASLYAGQPWRQRDEAVRSASFGAATLFYAAHAMGLGSGPMIGFDPEGVAREFGLGENEVPVVLVAVGYGTPENWPQKPRRPVQDVLSIV
ncbi:nitroreductase family protein [Glacieibacterium frigidum]|uniref:Nitroreductase family protein n=1 Tax=Glacieibacterium frigidum TaxID=2593303 RepID=A0A552U9R1_9SPHN|nr:nitroreductase family protein [Glacieibacterium frigidum]TRW14948.1 nitroreductase family protein [Glacieibacterium frigidum]